MNYVWLFFMMILCAGGYYEYTVLEQKITTDEQQVSDLNTKLDTLQSENKKLTDDNGKLSKTANDAQAAVSDLTGQLQSTQAALTQAQAKAKATETPAPATTTTTPAQPSNKMGTIATLDGKTYQNCQLLKVEADGIVVNQSEGIIKIQYAFLPPDLQKRFGYDIHVAPQLTDDQVQRQEQLRQAAQMAGN